MALGGATFAVTLVLCILTIVFSIMVLAYAGGINARGTAEQRAFQANLRKWLIGISSVLLAFAVVVVIVVGVSYGRARENPLAAL